MKPSKTRRTQSAAKRKSFTFLLDAVQVYADDWKEVRGRNPERADAWRATDGERLRDVVLAIASMLEGLSPVTDLRRMHDALTEAGRSDRDRRARVVIALHWLIWVWKRTAGHPERRKEVIGEALESVSEEHARFAQLGETEVATELSKLTGKAGAVHLAGLLGARCRAFGDLNAVTARDAYQKAINHRRKKGSTRSV